MTDWSIIQADAMKLLPKLPDGSVDLIITDIAYESMELHRKRGTTTRLKESNSSSNKWFETFSNYLIPPLFDQFERVLKNNGVMFFFCDETTMDLVKWQQNISHPGCRMSNGCRKCVCGLKYWKSINWTKTTLDGERVRAGTGYHFKAATEEIMYFEKGKVRLKGDGPDSLWLSDVIPDSLPGARVTGYPTEKPVEVIDRLLRPVAEGIGSKLTVLDPFCGSSPVGESAVRHGHKYIGIDLSGDACDVSRTRLAAIDAEPKPQQQELEL